MASTLQNVKISCRGGLDLRSTPQELLSRPGVASFLRNFETVSTGGYGRIKGFEPFGTTAVPGSGPIKGIHIFNESIMVARGDHLYHTFDTDTWVQVNKLVTDADFATIEAAGATAMDTNATDVRFDDYSHGTAEEDQMLIGVNGFDNAMFFKVNGTAHTNATYTFKYLDDVTTGTPAGCKFVVYFRDQFYISGQDETPSTVYVSTIFDPETWNGTNSLSISTGNPVTGLYPFRDNMIVFCENSIFFLKDANQGAAAVVLEPITKNIGCLNGDTIQEINGDLVYLAPDGIRTLAGTTRIDDVDISAISSLVRSVVRDLITDINDFELHSVVLREKAQYRLYYPYDDPATIGHLGLIGTLVYDDGGNLNWNWSTTIDIAPQHVTEGLFGGVYVSLMASKNDGVLYQHDVGDSFNGDPINANFMSHPFDIGDPSLRKNIHRVRTYVKPSGPANVEFSLEYSGYTDEDEDDPAPYILSEFNIPAIYGEATYDTGFRYDSRVVNIQVLNTEGSGFTVAVNYSSNSSLDRPYTIQGFDLDLIVAGKV